MSKTVLHDTGARIVIQQISDTHVKVSIDKTTVQLTFTDLQRLGESIVVAHRVRLSSDPR